MAIDYEDAKDEYEAEKGFSKYMKCDVDVNDKKQVVYVIISNYTDNPLKDLKVYSNGSEALKDLGEGDSLKVYQIERKR